MKVKVHKDIHEIYQVSPTSNADCITERMSGRYSATETSA